MKVHGSDLHHKHSTQQLLTPQPTITTLLIPIIYKLYTRFTQTTTITNQTFNNHYYVSAVIILLSERR